jgi:hypothetical protein
MPPRIFMRNKKRKSSSDFAPPGSPGAGTGPGSRGRNDSERRQSAAGGPEPRGSLAARIAALRRLTGWRAWAAKLATAVIIPAFLLVLAEASLRLLGQRFRKGIRI